MLTQSQKVKDKTYLWNLYKGYKILNFTIQRNEMVRFRIISTTQY